MKRLIARINGNRAAFLSSVLSAIGSGGLVALLIFGVSWVRGAGSETAQLARVCTDVERMESWREKHTEESADTLRQIEGRLAGIEAELKAMRREALVRQRRRG